MPYAFQGTVVIPPATGSTQTNITLVITGTDVKLKTVANGGQIQNTVSRVGQTVPADLILSSDQAGLNLYNWGWDFYDAVNGIATIWVLIPSLTSGASITIYVSIGNAAVSTYQGGAQGGEFDGNTKAVFHLPNGTVLSALDSSSNANNGTTTLAPTVNPNAVSIFTSASAGAVVGEIDGAASFGGNAAINCGHSASLSLVGTNIATIEVWFKRALSGSVGTLIEKGAINQGYVIMLGTAGATSTQLNVSKYGVVAIIFGNIPLDTNWHQLTMVYSSDVRAYLDGVLNATFSDSSNFTDDGGDFLMGMNVREGPYFWSGNIDEVKLSTFARSANWIATSYANQNSIPSISVFSGLGQKSRLTLLGIG